MFDYLLMNIFGEQIRGKFIYHRLHQYVVDVDICNRIISGAVGQYLGSCYYVFLRRGDSSIYGIDYI